jgi:Mg-chelatase subunit ChlD
MNDNHPKQNIPHLKRLSLSMHLEKISGLRVAPRTEVAGCAARLPNKAENERSRRTPDTVWALLDISGSMAGGPLEEAKRGFIDFCRAAVQQGYRVGFIAFNDDLQELSPATDKISALEERIQNLYAGGGTIMAAPIRHAAEKMKEASGARVIFLVTDGFPDDPEETVTLAQDCHRDGIDIIALGTGSADHEFLKRLASRTDLARHVPQVELHVSIAQTSRLLLKSVSRPR